MMKSASIAVLLFATTQVRAEAPLAPSGKWTVEYDDAGCLLSRDFGTGATLTTIGFKPSPFGDSVEIMVIKTPAVGLYRKGQAKVSLQPSGLEAESDAYIYGITAKNETIATLNVRGDVAKQLTSSTSLTIKVDHGPVANIEARGMEGAFGALKTCQTDLIRGWGIDPAELDKIATPPDSASPGNWITDSDYPKDAVAKHQEGTTVMVWSVNTAGRVADCKVVKSSGSPSLDQASCNAITLRGRYKPAIGTDGRPMVVHQMRKVVWRLPR